jgi:hypothetical protein
VYRLLVDSVARDSSNRIGTFGFAGKTGCYE